MDQIVHRILRFDRFALDLTRGCLRTGGQDIELRPKTFEVLRHLTENAGRLVPKQELNDAVWPDVIVSDDSLVQCIRELRQKLGDDDHRLIKTVARRGYLLDAALAPVATASGWNGPEVSAASPKVAPNPSPLRRTLRAVLGRNRRMWGAAVAAALLCVALGVVYAAYLVLANPRRPHNSFAGFVPAPPPPVSELFTEQTARRVAALARHKQLPVPVFLIRKSAAGVSDGARRFVGVWVSDTGWMVSNRQFMLIVTDVDRDGMAAGYAVNGPPQPKSHIQSPPHSRPFKGRIFGDSLSYSDNTGDHVASLTVQNRIEFKLTYRDGLVGVVVLDPVWTLVEAERAVTQPTSPDDARVTSRVD